MVILKANKVRKTIGQKISQYLLTRAWYLSKYTYLPFMKVQLAILFSPEYISDRVCSVWFSFEEKPEGPVAPVLAQISMANPILHKYYTWLLFI